MNFRLIPYNMASSSCKALQAALQERGHQCLRVNRNSTTYNYRQSHNVINWGCSDINILLESLNPKHWVAVASNKYRSFSRLHQHGVLVPTWTTDVFEATTWCQEGHTVVERHLLNSHSGRGIRIVSDPLDIQAAPLYTIYQKKTAEYRVHVLPAEQCYHHSHDRPVIINQKRRRQDVPSSEVNWQIRNHANGFVYCRDNVDSVLGLKELAVRAVDALCLDFGAVDILYHAPTETMLVLEVNTAPGLTGSLVDEYADAFVKAFGG